MSCVTNPTTGRKIKIDGPTFNKLSSRQKNQALKSQHVECTFGKKNAPKKKNTPKKTNKPKKKDTPKKTNKPKKKNTPKKTSKSKKINYEEYYNFHEMLVEANKKIASLIKDKKQSELLTRIAKESGNQAPEVFSDVVENYFDTLNETEYDPKVEKIWEDFSTEFSKKMGKLFGEAEKPKNLKKPKRKKRVYNYYNAFSDMNNEMINAIKDEKNSVKFMSQLNDIVAERLGERLIKNYQLSNYYDVLKSIPFKNSKVGKEAEKIWTDFLEYHNLNWKRFKKKKLFKY